MKVSFLTEIDVPDNLGEFQAIEIKIKEALVLTGQSLFCDVLALKESQFQKEHHFSVKDRRPKNFQTIAGEIYYPRLRVIDSQTGKYRYPVDEWLGVRGKERMTKVLIGTLARTCVQRSYRQASAEIAQWAGVKRSSMANWKTIQVYSKRLQQKEEQERTIYDWQRKPMPHLPQGIKNPCPILAMDPDGTYCRNQDRDGKDHDVKAAVLYTGKAAVDKKGKKLKLIKKQTLLSRSSESVQDFFNRVTQTAMTHYGANQKTQVVIHGDGDAWIKGLKTDYWDQALIRLDPWHLMKKMREALGARQEIPKHWIELIYGRPDELISTIGLFTVSRTAPQSSEREKFRDLINYIKNNREGLLPSGIDQETKKKYPGMFKRGSGTIESNIGHGFGARFKQARMSWSKQGLDNLVYLREKYLNGDMKPLFRVPQPLTRKKFAELTGRSLI